ncbi:HNH endonuclease [Prosthecobacter debontii]|uniref:HNH endonuclease n=1 Tax=Prosthecobacter debontii TaxID=48467 RepID=A0A1T4YSC8_9BACT|nr:HNH endonuclease [Prosthecobacter debontii]
MDRQIWEELGENADELRYQADLIHRALDSLDKLRLEVEDDQFREGRLVTELHKRRERDPRLRSRLLKHRRSKGALSCDICQVVAKSANESYEDAIFEAHHLNPLFTGERVSSLQDVALLCANCHRLLHRLIAHTGRWMTLEEARATLI